MALIPGNAGFVVVLCTAPPDLAEVLAKTLVEERLAACINRIPVESTYLWEGDMCLDEEILMLIKTTTKTLPALKNRISEIHTYEVPEIIAIPVIFGSKEYLNWVKENTSIPK